jgi:serine/threonine protein kinase
MSVEPGEGRLLQGRYRIERALKQGGSGAVYLAWDTRWGDSACAIKELLPRGPQSPEEAAYAERSFKKEVEVLTALQHPHIPKVRDFFSEDGHRYIVMDLVRGPSLQDELIECHQQTGQPLDPEKVALDMLQVLQTLRYLHEQNPPIVHRDVKPANLIRDEPTGKVKLVDFGTARIVDSAALQTRVGTMGFGAPEQMLGRAEPRSDIFSVGVTLYHLCTGQLPSAKQFEPLHLDRPGYAGLSRIIFRATQVKASQRFGSASEMEQALRAWLSEPQRALAESQPAILVSSSAASTSAMPLLIAAAGLVVAVWAFALLRGTPDRPVASVIATSSPVVAVTPQVTAAQPPKVSPLVRPSRPSVAKPRPAKTGAPRAVPIPVKRQVAQPTLPSQPSYVQVSSPTDFVEQTPQLWVRGQERLEVSTSAGSPAQALESQRERFAEFSKQIQTDAVTLVRPRTDGFDLVILLPGIELRGRLEKLDESTQQAGGRVVVQLMTGRRDSTPRS